MLALDQGASTTCPGLPWTLLAAIGTVESDNEQSTLPGVHSGATQPAPKVPCSPGRPPSPPTMPPVPPGGGSPPTPTTRPTPSTPPRVVSGRRRPTTPTGAIPAPAAPVGSAANDTA